MTNQEQRTTNNEPTQFQRSLLGSVAFIWPLATDHRPLAVGEFSSKRIDRE